MIQVTDYKADGIWQMIIVFDEVVRARDLIRWLEEREVHETNPNVKAVYNTVKTLVEKDMTRSVNEALKLLQYWSNKSKGINYYDSPGTPDSKASSIFGSNAQQQDSGVKVENSG